MEPLEHLEELRRASPGTARHARVRREESGPWEIAWLIREKSAQIVRIGGSPEVEFRFGLLLEPSSKEPAVTVGLAAILVRVGPQDWRHVYETWIDPVADGALELLAYQQRIRVYLYGDRGELERKLTVDNPLATFAQQCLARVSGRQPWSEDQFRRARAQIYKRHPDVWNLWQTLQQLDSSE